MIGDASTISLITALGAGFVSFLAPCVLPLIPGYLSFLAGSTLGGKAPTRREIFLTSVSFVLGFSIVFALLGALLSSVLASVAYDVQLWLSRIGGVLMIIFGLSLANLISFSFLSREHKAFTPKRFSSRYLTGVVFGFAFAAGWTPCVGPALGAILGLATTAPGSAFWLLLAYAIGLGIPFLIVGLFTSSAQTFIVRYERPLARVSVVFGYILIILGVLVFTQKLSLVANWGLLNQLLLS